MGTVLVCVAGSVDAGRDLRVEWWGQALIGLGVAGFASAVVAVSWFVASLDACFVF